VLQAGGVVEDGAPEDLLRRRGVYQGMVHGEIARLMPAAQAA
jgi:ABC-type multidrug transport system fused ATPase/permease subunit